jgi:importin subunit beta-1
VKPAVLSCFGDIALAIGGRFEVYLDLSMAVLVQAAGMRVAAVCDIDLIALFSNAPSYFCRSTRLID